VNDFGIMNLHVINVLVRLKKVQITWDWKLWADYWTVLTSQRSRQLWSGTSALHHQPTSFFALYPNKLRQTHFTIHLQSGYFSLKHWAEMSSDCVCIS